MCEAAAFPFVYIFFSRVKEGKKERKWIGKVAARKNTVAVAY
jgi:hypothetical protein